MKDLIFKAVCAAISFNGIDSKLYAKAGTLGNWFDLSIHNKDLNKLEFSATVKIDGSDFEKKVNEFIEKLNELKG